MSKIQEALGKIQALSSHVGGASEIPPTQESIATLMRPAKGDSGEDGDQQPMIHVDRGKLRAAGLLAPVSQERDLADQYRKIKRPLLEFASGLMADTSSLANLIMIASALPNDGKTFTCINLALSMATETDTTVLLVDADVPKPNISRIFGVGDQPGLIDLLLDDEKDVLDVTLNTNVPGLRLLPAGQSNEHATELLASKRMVDVVKQLSSTYPDRIVIFDSPPLLVTSEANVLASLMGQIALVVCADRTPKQAVLEALESLDESKAIGTILNQGAADSAKPGYGYYGSMAGNDHPDN